jgi:hypothetical protein
MTLNVQDIRDRMPLAEAVWLECRHVTDDAFLEQIFEAHRGSSYTRILSFPQMVHLIGDALLQHEGSGRRAFETEREAGKLPTSIPSVYEKLRGIPVEVSMGFLNGCADRTLELYPAGVGPPVPKSLAGFEVLILDGKTVKWVQKRLKVVRKAGGGAVGGKALVCLSMNRGLVVGMHAHPDGDANEVRFVPDLLPEVRKRMAGPRLFVSDRAFCDRRQADRFREEGDHFIFRYHPHVQFQPDPTLPQRIGRDAEGRRYVESWGWLGTRKDPQHVFVRQIVLDREDEEPLVLFTDLLDADRYPAVDILEVYRNRWGIERVFQQVTEVFGLQKLIGTSPRATLFQLAFSLLIYNLIQVVRAHIARAQERPVQSISTEKLFDDVEKHLHAWNLFLTPEATASYLKSFDTLEKVNRRLSQVLADSWTNVWLKSPPQRRRPPGRKSHKRAHVSVFRLIEADRAQGRSQKEKHHA